MLSEVARIRQQIELECQAMQHIREGFAAVASHESIQHRFTRIGAYQDELAQLIGTQAAKDTCAQIYINTVG